MEDLDHDEIRKTIKQAVEANRISEDASTDEVKNVSLKQCMIKLTKNRLLYILNFYVFI